MNINYKKLILSTIAITLSALIVVSVVFFSLSYFVFTKWFADVCYNSGSDKLAGTLYYRVYEKNDDIFYCYKGLNLKIKVGDDKNIVKYYKEFASDNEYAEFMAYLNDTNNNLNGTIIEKSMLLNEDNYLKKAFVSALINTDRDIEAFEYAIEYFSDYKSFDFYNQGAYVLSQFINSSEKFNIIYDKYSIKLIDAMQDYFENSYQLFMDNKDVQGELDKAYLLSLGNRIKQVGEDLKVIYTGLEITDYTTINYEKLNEVNTLLKGVL